MNTLMKKNANELSRWCRSEFLDCVVGKSLSHNTFRQVMNSDGDLTHFFFFRFRSSKPLRKSSVKQMPKNSFHFREKCVCLRKLTRLSFC